MLSNYQEILKNYCKRLNYEIVNVFVNEKIWILTIKVGTSVLTIEKRTELDFCVFFYTVRFTDKELIEILEKNDLNPQFVFGIKSSLFNQTTSTYFITENSHLRGFHVSKNVFIDDSSFTLKEFYDAVLAVAGTGSLGLAYIDTYFGNHNIQQKIGEEFPKTSPDGMYY